MTLYGSNFYRNKLPEGESVEIEGLSARAVVHKGGLCIEGTDGNTVSFFIFKYLVLFKCLYSVFKCI